MHFGFAPIISACNQHTDVHVHTHVTPRGVVVQSLTSCSTVFVWTHGMLLRPSLDVSNFFRDGCLLNTDFRSPKTAQVMQKVGLERLVLETDHEDAALVQGSTRDGMQFLAQTFDVDEDTVIQTTTWNAHTLCGIPLPSSSFVGCKLSALAVKLILWGMVGCVAP